MKFTICHDTSKKTLAIPRAALQLSGLANAERLSLHTGRGCIVLTRQVPTIRERLESIRLLHDLNVGMVCRLALDSRTASGMPCKRASDAINTMAKDLSLSRSTIKRALAELIRQGRVEKQVRFRENGGCSSNYYQLK